MENKLAQDRSGWSRLKERVNVPGRIQERMDPELRKAMNDMRSADKEIRRVSQDAKLNLRQAKTAFRKRDHLSAASYLAAFHQSCKTVAGILNDFTKTVNIQHFDYIYNSSDRGRAQELFEYDPHKRYEKEAAAALDFETLVSTADIWENWARRRRENNFQKGFLKKTIDMTSQLLDAAGSMLSSLLESFSVLENAVISRNVEAYTDEAKRFITAFRTYDKVYLKYYRDIVVPLRDHAQKQDADLMPSAPTANPGSSTVPGKLNPSAVPDLDVPNKPPMAAKPEIAPGSPDLDFKSQKSTRAPNWDVPDLDEAKSPSSSSIPPQSPFTGYDDGQFDSPAQAPRLLALNPGPKKVDPVEIKIDPSKEIMELEPHRLDPHKEPLALPAGEPAPAPTPEPTPDQTPATEEKTPAGKKKRTPAPKKTKVETPKKVTETVKVETPTMETTTKKETKKKTPAPKTKAANFFELGKIASEYLDPADLIEDDATPIDMIAPDDLGPKALKRRQDKSFFNDLHDDSDVVTSLPPEFEAEYQKMKGQHMENRLNKLRRMSPNKTDALRNEPILQRMEEIHGDPLELTEDPSELDWFAKGDELEDLEDIEASFMSNMSKFAEANDPDSMLDTILSYAEKIENSNPSGSIYLTRIASVLHEEKTAGIFGDQKKKDLNRPPAESYRGKGYSEYQDDNLGKKKLDIGIGPINQSFSAIPDLNADRIKITPRAHMKILGTIVNRLAVQEDDRERLQEFKHAVQRKLDDSLVYAIRNGVILSSHGTKYDSVNPDDRVLTIFTRLNLSEFHSDLDGIGQIVVECRVKASNRQISVNSINANFKVIQIDDDDEDVEPEDDDSVDIEIEDYDDGDY